MGGKYRVLTVVFLTLSVFLLCAYLFLPSYFYSLDNRFRDFYFKFRGSEKVSDDIVIVDIDEKSIRELGQWPWERYKIAKIINNLSSLGAGIIGVDIVFSEYDKTSPKHLAEKFGLNAKEMPDYDSILAQSVASTPTILSFVFDLNHENKNQPLNIPAVFIEKNIQKQEYLPVAKGVLGNIAILQKAAYSGGYMNNIPDETGVIRSVPMLMKYDNGIYPSLSFEMYRIATGSRKVVVEYSTAGVKKVALSKENIPSDRFGRLYLNFRGASKSYRYISAVDIYNNSVAKNLIEHKFVLIGTSAYGLMDLRSTPLDNVIPGVEIHANMIDNLLKHDMLYHPLWAELLDIVVIIFILFTVLFLYSRFSFFTFVFVSMFSFFSIIYFNYYLLFYEHFILNSVFPIISFFLALIATLGINYMFESKQKEVIKKSFSKKVSKQVMEDLLKNPNSADLTTREVEVSIYFSDIRSFTTISENLKSPKRITDFLNYYMDVMVESVEQSSGTIDKFIGDAIMAYWNAPVAVEKHADKAVQTALKQIEKRDFLNVKMKKEFGFEIDYGIGINTGDVVVGEIGSIGRSDYTIIGDAVNLASRLEGMCKIYGVRLVISEFTKNKLQEDYVLQLLDIVRVKGKSEPVEIYEVLDFAKPSKQKTVELNLYSEAHRLYMGCDFKKAKNIFQNLYDVYEKYLYKLYKERCEYLIKENIENFDGVFTFTTK